MNNEKDKKGRQIMTYRIEQFVKKINAPIVCKAKDKEFSFDSGAELAAYEFDKHYQIDSVEIKDSKAILNLSVFVTPDINSIGEETVPGTDWIKEHVERFGKEPNLFDGV